MAHYCLMCSLLLILILAITAQAADSPEAAFKNTHALLTLGQDDQVYLSSYDHILHCNHDGSHPVLGKTEMALTNATANAQGVIAAGHAHFQKNVTLYDGDFNTLERFTRIGDYNFTAPAEIATGPSGDFYALDQGRDQIIRFHPDGIRCAVYQIPHEPAGTARDGYLTHFRVCEQTKTLYVVNWVTLRCFSTDSPAFQYTPKLRWKLETPLCTNFSWGYGGFDVDEQGILYTMNTTGEEFINSYDADGKFLKKIVLKMGDRHPVDPTRVLGLRVSKGEVFVKRAHESELFLRFSLESGDLLTVASAPADYATILRTPTTVDGGKPIAPVKSTLGLPADRPVLRVLFIGNSQVNCVRDIPDFVEEISRTVPNTKAPIIVADEVVIGGIGLEGYWKSDLVHKRIAAGGWDYVVINDIVYSFGVTSTAKFMEYAAKFDAEIKKAGAKTVVFSTADVEKKREQQAKMYADALTFAHESHCLVAGAGMAWLKAWDKEPTLDLHYTDRAHPNALGYYLNACVIYATLTGNSPLGEHVSTCGAATKEQAAMMQTIAWTQYQDDRKNEK